MTKTIMRNLFLLAVACVPFYSFAQNDYLVTINPTGPTHLRMGEQCTITLSERELLQGYQWHYAFSDYNKIAKVSEKENSTSRTFVFKAIEPGHVRIDFAVYDAKQGKGSIRQKKEYWITVHELNDPAYAEANKSQIVSAERHWQTIKTAESQPPLNTEAASQPKNVSKPVPQPTKSSRTQQETEESSTAVTTTVKSPIKKDKAELQADVARVNRQREMKNESEQNPDNQITTDLAKPSPKPATARPAKTSEMAEVEIVDGSSIQGQVKPNTKKLNEQENPSGKTPKTEKPVSAEPKVIAPRKKLNEPSEEELADAVVVNTQTKTVSKPQVSPKPTVENKPERGVSKAATTPSESVNVRKIAAITEDDSDAPLADATPKAVARPVAKTETPVKPEKTTRSSPVSKEPLPQAKQEKRSPVSQDDEAIAANNQPPVKAAKPAATHKHTQVAETETRTIKPRHTDEKTVENKKESVAKAEPKPAKTSPAKPASAAPKVISRPAAATVADEPQSQSAEPVRITESRNNEMQQSDFEASSLKNTGKSKFDPNYEAAPQPTQKTPSAPAKISQTDNSTYAAFHQNAKILTWQRENVIDAGQEFCVDFYNNIPDARWVHDYDNKNFVYEEDRIFAGASVAAGLPDIHSFRFRTLQKGRYTLTFHLFSKNNPQIDKYVNYEIWVK